MDRSQLPLNALRAFEAAARHASFTRAAQELCVTQAAVSHQVRGLEAQLGVELFRRLPRGLGLTGEGEVLYPIVHEALDRMSQAIDVLADGADREVLNVGVVGTFAVAWLLPRLEQFQRRFPFVDVRVSTHNNKIELTLEGLDYAIRFGTGAWHGTEATPLMEAPLTVLCAPALGERLTQPSDVLHQTLLRSYRTDEWNAWLSAAGVDTHLSFPRTVIFDSSIAMMEVVIQGGGVALAPAVMFRRQLAEGRIVRPFRTQVALGGYWLTRLQHHGETPAMSAFKRWLIESLSAESGEAG